MSLAIHRVLLLICVALFLNALGYRVVLAQSSALSEAASAFYRGDYGLATQLAERHLRTYPNDAAMRVIWARIALAESNLPQAFEELQKALAADPKNIDALYYLSLTARELSHREYQRLLSLAPDSARAHQLLGEAALATENQSEAEKEFDSALNANPRSAEVATELAELKRSQSKFDEAITYYTQALRFDPLTYDNAYGLGACYTYKQDYVQAIEWLRKAVALAPNSAAAHFALGNALFQNGQLAAAIPELNAALRQEPRLKQAYFLLGRAYSKLGRAEESKAALEKLDEMNRAEVPNDGKRPQQNGPSKPRRP
jgi:tetratricopeptide (TPR) repeat protein